MVFVPIVTGNKFVPLISLNDVTVQYDVTPVLTHVDFSVDLGEIVTIVGPNGSGKSSLLHVLTGAIQPSKGHITRRDGLKIGFVPQKLLVEKTFPITVRRFLSLPNKVSDVDARAALF